MCKFRQKGGGRVLINRNGGGRDSHMKRRGCSSYLTGKTGFGVKVLSGSFSDTFKRH